MKILGLAIVMVAVLASCGDNGKKKNESSDSSELSIAFYVKDSISTNYIYFKESQEEIAEMEEKLAVKVNALQQDYAKYANEYQSKMQRGLLSKNGETFYTNKIQKLQLEMTSLEQTEGAELSEKADEFQKELLDKLDQYGKEFAEKNNYNLILAKEKMGAILHGDASMDVTMDLIEYMNEQDKK